MRWSLMGRFCRLQSLQNSLSIGAGGAMIRHLARPAFLALVLVCVAGCPNNPPDDNNNGNDNGNTNDNTSTEAEILSPLTNFGISELEEPVSILYTVDDDAENVQGYYVPVSGSATGSPAIGDRVLAASNLEAGERQAFSFDPGEAGVGYFRVGILFDLDAETGENAESTAVIQVQGPPDPIFFQPPDLINEVESGDSVLIGFDARDPEAIVQWRLFYFTPGDLLDGDQDELGVEIATGSGNAGSVNFSTVDLALGDYQLGLSATDSGLSVAATVASGQVRRIVFIPGVGESTPILRIVAAP